jgi:hypothetical protein
MDLILSRRIMALHIEYSDHLLGEFRSLYQALARADGVRMFNHLSGLVDPGIEA